MKNGKLIVIAAPSGSGKTTIVKNLISDKSLNLGFSVSATSREKRKNGGVGPSRSNARRSVRHRVKFKCNR